MKIGFMQNQKISHGIEIKFVGLCADNYMYYIRTHFYLIKLKF